MNNARCSSNLSKRMSRRDLLVGASSGVAVSLAGAALPAWSESPRANAAAAGPQGSAQGAAKRTLSPASMPKAWSSEEFRRRWQNVRQGMKENHFDCLIVPQHSTQAMIHDRQDGDADVQYHVGIPAGWVMVPAEGKITAISSR